MPSFERAPQFYARVGGLLYLAIIVFGLFGELVVRGTLVIAGDATATAEHIARSPELWRAGIAGDLLMHVCDVPLILIFYALLRPVSKSLALLATLFNLVQTAVLAVNKLTLLVPVFLSEDVAYLQVLSAPQLHALSYLAIKAHGYGFGIGLLFFGFACLVRGHLMVKSAYLPQTLGRLLQIAGLAYVINSLVLLLAPSFSPLIFRVVVVPILIGELSVCLWLIVKGVDKGQWELRTGPAARPWR